MNMTNHQITLVVDQSREFYATVTEDGNIVTTGSGEVLEVHETNLWCSVCGRLSADEYAEHGISDYWEEQ